MVNYIEKKVQNKAALILACMLAFFSFIQIVDAGNYRFQNASGNDLMIINGSSGKVGIGTSSPSQKLTVIGQVNITADTATLLDVRNTGGSGDEIAIAGHTLESGNAAGTAGYLGGYDGQYNKWFGVRGTTASSGGVAVLGNASAGGYAGLFLGGNVGIGTVAPGQKLTVVGTFNTTGLSYFGSNISVGGYQINNLGTPKLSTDAATKAYVDSITGGGSATWSLTSGVVHLNDTTDKVSIGGTTSAYKLDVVGNVSLNNSLFVTNAGNVGIGTSSPGAKLEVVGTVKAQHFSLNESYYGAINDLSGGADVASSIFHGYTNVYQHAPIYVVEFWNSTSNAWENWTGSGAENLFDGRPETLFTITDKKKFRVVIGPVATYVSSGILGVWHYWTSSGTQKYNLTLEAGPSNTGPWGELGNKSNTITSAYQRLWQFTDHSSNNTKRITFDYSADTGNSTLRDVGFFTQFNSPTYGYKGMPFYWDYNKRVTLSEITVDTNTLFVNGTSNNVGIGTTSPTQKLDVRGSINVSGDVFINNATSLTAASANWYNHTSTTYNAYNTAWSATYNVTYNTWAYNQTTGAITYTDNKISANNASWTSTYNSTYAALSSSSGTNTHLHNAANITAGTFGAGNFVFQNNLTVGGSTLFVNNGTGRVGIGTVTPSAKLNLYNPGSGGAGTVGIGENFRISSYLPNIALDDLSSSSINYTIHSNEGVLTIGRYYNSTNATGDLVLSGGNVGIGTSTPGQKLNVIGALNITNASGTLGLFQTNAGNVGIGTGVPGTKLQIGTSSDTKDTIVRALSGDSNVAGFEAYGNSQGTGYVFVGQSSIYGGGMFYNGDGNPTFATGESDDAISFYRMSNSAKEVVFSYLHNSNVVNFRGNISVGGFQINNLGTPKLSTDAATKAYVDSVTGGGSATWSKSGSNVYVNTTSDRVSIGGTTSGYKLDVVGNVSLNNSLFVTNAGNVGIGTSSPGAKLEVVGSGGIKTSDGSVYHFTKRIAASYQDYAYHYLKLFKMPLNASNELAITVSGRVSVYRSNDLAVSGSAEIYASRGWSQNVRYSVWKQAGGKDFSIVNLTEGGEEWIALMYDTHTGASISEWDVDLQVYSTNNSFLALTSHANSTTVYHSNSIASATPQENYFLGGNMGLGTVDPTQKLDVRGSINVSGDVFINNATSLTAASANWYNHTSTTYNAYNTAWSATYNVTYNTWAYNQTTGAITYTDNKISANNASWTSTYNATYAALSSTSGTNTHLHNAANITAGTFGAGNFAFRNNLTVGGSTLFVNNGTGRVGIGTTNPLANLHIVSSDPVIRLSDTSANNVSLSTSTGSLIISPSSATGVQIQGVNIGSARYMALRVNNNTAYGEIVAPATYGLNLVSGSVTGVSIDADGDVGIGTTNPTHKLTVAGTLNVTGLTYHTSNLSMGGYQINNLGTPKLSTDAATKAYVDLATGGGSATWTKSGSNVFLNNTGDSVGIGTATPRSKLQVHGGNLEISGNYSNSVIRDSARQGSIYLSSSASNYQTGYGASTSSFVASYNALELKSLAGLNPSNEQQIILDEPSTNIVTNPSVETAATTWSTWVNSGAGWGGRTSEDSYSGTYSWKANVSSAGSVGNRAGCTDVSANSIYTMSAWIKVPSVGATPILFYVREYDGSLCSDGAGSNRNIASVYSASTVTNGTDGWVRISKTFNTSATGQSLSLSWYIANVEDITYVDALQIEAKNYSTTYLDGSLGAGYSWTGTAHASSSVRDGSILMGGKVNKALAVYNTGTVESSEDTYLATESGGVGIGTSSTTSKLEVVGNVSFSNSTGGQGLYQSGYGFVAIGHKGPTQKLDVRGNINVSGDIYVNNATSLATWAYNQTTGAITYIDNKISANNASWTSTYNATYAALSSTSGTNTHLHNAANITAGTFGAGNFAFQNNLTVGGSTLFVNNGTGRVGIGTTNPLANLHIVSSDPVIRLSDTSANNVSLSTSTGSLIISPSSATGVQIQGVNGGSARYMALRVNNNTAYGEIVAPATYGLNLVSGNGAIGVSMTIDGNVGIGTSSPTDKLHLYDATDAQLVIQRGSTTSGAEAGLKFKITTDTSDDYQYAGIIAERRSDSLANLHLANRNSAGALTSADARLTILPTGEVGIGTVSPQNKLQVTVSSGATTAIKTNGLIEDVSGVENYVSSRNWNVGNGTTGIFSVNGATNENVRELGPNPYGVTSILWAAYNDVESGPDGGWDTSYFSIDSNKTYRFMVWINKTGSTDGSSYFGTTGSPAAVKNLTDSDNTNPYFWSGDLPQLGKWYLLVGYVHPYHYNSTINYGGIYDGETGEKVVSARDFKSQWNTTSLRQRAYLYYDTTPADRQYYWGPRVEEVNGREPSIESILGVTRSATQASNSYFGGNMGIGTAAPGQKLTVVGTFNATGLSYFGSNITVDNSIRAATSKDLVIDGSTGSGNVIIKLG